MVLLSDYIKAVDGKLLTGQADPSKIEIRDAYVSDMLSDVMGNAKPGMIWITIMKHLNVIAVASMTGMNTILFARNSFPDQPVIDKAIEEDICLVQSPKTVFELAGILFKLLGN